MYKKLEIIFSQLLENGAVFIHKHDLIALKDTWPTGRRGESLRKFPGGYHSSGKEEKRKTIKYMK